MGLSSSKTKTSSNTVQTPNVPDWIQGPTKGIVDQISGMVNQRPTPTPASTLQTQAFGAAANLPANVTQGAQAATQGLMGYTPQSVTADQLASTDLSPYMNPYQNDVIGGLMGDFNQANLMGANAISAGMPTGAYGGSRQAVGLGQMVGDNTRTFSNALANVRQQGYQSAQDAARFDIGNKLGADQFNSQQGLAGANFNLGAANQLGTLGLADAANTRANTGLLGDLGATQHEIDQANNPQNAQMQYLSNLLGMIGQANPGLYTGQTANSNSTTKESGSLLGGLGGFLQSLGSMGGGMKPI